MIFLKVCIHGEVLVWRALYVKYFVHNPLKPGWGGGGGESGAWNTVYWTESSAFLKHGLPNGGYGGLLVCFSYDLLDVHMNSL